MAPLIHSVCYYEVANPLVKESYGNNKTIEASSHPILINPDVPRLVTYASRANTCFKCNKTSNQYCVYCYETVLYCNADCQNYHWPLYKDQYKLLKILYFNEAAEARVTEHPGKKIPVVSFAPNKIYHHTTVDPINVMKQCIHICIHKCSHSSKFLPDWCNWESVEEEYIPFESESEESDTETSDSESEESDTEAWNTTLLYVDFAFNLLDDKSNIESESDEAYVPSRSLSDAELSHESDLSNHEDDYLMVGYKVDCLIHNHKQLDYPEFIKRVFNNQPVLESDSEDYEYENIESDYEESDESEESSISDNEVDHLLVEWKQYMKKSDYFKYKFFRSKLIAEDPSKLHVLNDSIDGCFVLPDKSLDASDESKEKLLKESLDLENDIHHFIAEYKEFLYQDFNERLYNNQIMESDSEDQDYEISESDSECLSEDSFISNYDEDFFMLQCKVDCLIDNCKQLNYAEFINSVLHDKSVLESDSEDEDYEISESDSDYSNLSESDSDDYWSADEYQISDHEANHLIAESMHIIRNSPEFKRNFYDESDIVSDSEDENYDLLESDDDFWLEDEVNHLIVEWKHYIKNYDYHFYGYWVVDNRLFMHLDSDTEYDTSESESSEYDSSDVSYIPDYEVDSLLAEWKQYVKNYDYAYYIYFKHLIIVDNPSKIDVLSNFHDDTPPLGYWKF